MPPKARHCDECRHWVDDPNWDMSDWMTMCVCAMGHKPRFYMPKDDDHLEYGWKRRCEDFEEDER